MLTADGVRARPAVAMLVAVAVLAGCQHGAPLRAETAAASVPADDNLNAVLWMQASTEYRAATTQTWRAAIAQLDAALADPAWDALVPQERANPPAGLPPAVIVDIDETVLDNSPYQARLVLDGAEFNDAGWDAWVAEERARPVAGVLEFAQAAAARGVAIVYVSNRTRDQAAASLANLRAVGLPGADGSLYLGKGTAVEGCSQPGSSSGKQCRRQQVGRRYRVLMQFGDQLGDFVGQDHQATVMQTHGDWFGRRWWVLPNPSYGDWQAAPFQRDWSRPAQARRAAKRAALDPAR